MEGLKILIVDDEEDFVSTLAERLVLRGFQVEVAMRGMDALRHVREDDFNVLILDVKMPGIGGLDLMAEIKQKHPDLPVVLLTGYGSEAEAQRGMAEGALEYLMKPIDVDELTEKIRDAAGRNRGEQ